MSRRVEGLSRRKLLAGVGSIGALGALSGLGTAAYFNDDEQFETLSYTAGSLDLEINGESNDNHQVTFAATPTAPSGEETFTLSLPADGQNNAAFLWLRADCLSFVEEVDSQLGETLSVTLSYCQPPPGETESEVIAVGTLNEVTTALLGGIPLDANRYGSGSLNPDEQACLEPGTELCLRLAWTLDPSTLDGQERSVSVDYHFKAIQCRHVRAGTNPFPIPEQEPCAEGPGLSLVAFCVESGELTPDDITTLYVFTNSAGEPAKVYWKSTVEIETVVLKYGNKFTPTGTGLETFRVEGTSGTVSPGRGIIVPADSAQTEQCPCPLGSVGGIKYEFEEDSWETLTCSTR